MTGTRRAAIHQRVGRWAAILWPWVSLVMGLASAALMDRRPERATLVIAAIVAGWAAIIALVLLERRAPASATAAPGRGGAERRREPSAVRAARFVSRTAALGPVQFALFFTLPFYWRAHAGTSGQLAFLLVLVVAAAVTLWDPLLRFLAAHPAGAAVLLSTAAFAGLAAMLPIVGLSNRVSLAIAAATPVIAAPLALLLTGAAGVRRARGVADGARPARPWRRFAYVLLLGALWPAVMLLPAGRRLVPAAPLRLVDGAMGTAMADLTLVDPTTRFAAAPPQLVCFTSLWAPRGLADALVHVWRKDGVVVDRIPLEIRGGRDAGFRTWSVKQHLGADPRGRWSCSVETASGQFLGERGAVVVGP